MPLSFPLYTLNSELCHQFINVAANNQELAPVNNLQTSKKPEVKHFILSNPRRPSRPLIFVDTHGFDQTKESDDAILKRITRWLKDS